jgi:hypothetical protein
VTLLRRLQLCVRAVPQRDHKEGLLNIPGFCSIMSKEENDMYSEAIRELLARRPFEPFEVRLSNGDVHIVKHPECVVVTKTRLILADLDADRVTIVALLHVESVAMIHPVSA